MRVTENEMASFVFLFVVPSGGVHQCCDIQVEPLCRRQELLSESVSVCLTAVLQGWDSSSLTQTISESWVLQCCSSQGAEAFQHLLTVLSARGLHMVRRPHSTRAPIDALFVFLSVFCLLLSATAQ